MGSCDRERWGRAAPLALYPARRSLCPPWGGSATGEAWAAPGPEGEGVGEGMGARAWVTWPCRPPRAPVLVALALIESGMKYEDAIQFIRQ